VKRSKYTFAKKKGEYLGHMITGEGVSIDPKKIAAMLEWPKLQFVKELRGFLGLIGIHSKLWNYQ